MSAPDAELSAHIVDVKAIYCNDCDAMKTSACASDSDAASELAEVGWRVVWGEAEDYYLSVCRSCSKRRDVEAHAAEVDLLAALAGAIDRAKATRREGADS